MYRWLMLSAIALMVVADAPAAKNTPVSGLYVEARTCEIWTGACFGNAELNLAGKNAVMAWKVEKGVVDDVTLDGLGVVAVIGASDTLGQEQTGPTKAVLIVDANADAAQRQALINLAKKQGGALVRNVIRVDSAMLDLTVGQGKNAQNAQLLAGTASIKTRAIDPERDKACGGEKEYYPPLTRNVKASAAMTLEHTFTGKGFRETWKDPGRRSAYVGRFEIP